MEKSDESVVSTGGNMLCQVTVIDKKVEGNDKN